ncbi:MAG: ribonuclease HII [Candidatus Paceibacterota bacterium]|jgi:ribonuclease HII
MGNSEIIGIDEVGRGPLAGPVAVGAFAVKSKAVLRRFKGVKDSKQLSEKQREKWMSMIDSDRPLLYDYVVSLVDAKTIDRVGIVKAIQMAINSCLRKLEKRGFATFHSKILLDGSLKAPTKFKDQKTIIRGDAKEAIIALASICAKVKRDRHMKRISKKYTEYGLEIHKGYGTKSHYMALKKYGPCKEHRLTFLKL